MWTARLFCALALGAPMAPAALAGAWPREEGEVFLSFGANVLLFDGARRPVHYDPTFYLEYGLTPRLTLGLDGFTADESTVRSLFAFVRVPLDDGTGPNRLAVSGGLGRTILPESDTPEAAARLGLHWGRGLDTGWLAVDAEAVHRLAGGPDETKIDLTWGYRFAEDWSAVLVAQAGTARAGEFYAKVSPSLLWDVSDRVQLRMGLTQALTGDEGTGLLLQGWIRF